MAHNLGRQRSREHESYEIFRAGATVKYNYPDERSGNNSRARPETPPPPRRRRPLRGLAEYSLELERAVSRGPRLGPPEIVETTRSCPFAHLGKMRSADNLRRKLTDYADVSYPPDGKRNSYFRDFVRELDKVEDLIDSSWHGAELCSARDPPRDWREILNVLTGYLQGANDLYDRVQTVITKCERAMYDRKGRFRTDANEKFAKAFVKSRERARLADDMGDWVGLATSRGGHPHLLVRDARRQEHHERRR